MTSKPTLVGLLGRKGSGKDTAAQVLISQGYENVKFAGGLKEMLRSLLAYQGVDEETIERMIDGDLKEVPTDYLAGQTPRYAMQTLGTEWGRDLIDENLWVGVARNRFIQGPSVVTDVRFPNEVEAILGEDGEVFGIVADWIKPQADEHESEAKIDDLISSLDDSRLVKNFRAPSTEEIPQTIQEFRTRFAGKVEAVRKAA